MTIVENLQPHDVVNCIKLDDIYVSNILNTIRKSMIMYLECLLVGSVRRGGDEGEGGVAGGSREVESQETGESPAGASCDGVSGLDSDLPFGWNKF